MIYSGMMPMFSDSYLAHEGKKRRSGRYPYGSGEDPYQHDPGHHSAKAARQAAKDAKKTKRKADRIKSRRAKKEKLAAQEAKKQAEEAQKQEEAKYNAIASGNAEEIRKYSSQMTNEEIKYAIDRIDKMKKLSELTGPEKSKLETAEDKIDSVMKHVKKATDWVNTAADAAGAVSKLQKNIEPFTSKGKNAKNEQAANDEFVRTSTNISDILNRRGSLTDKQLQSAASRQEAINKLQQVQKSRDEAAKKSAEEQRKKDNGNDETRSEKKQASEPEQKSKSAETPKSESKLKTESKQVEAPKSESKSSDNSTESRMKQNLTKKEGETENDKRARESRARRDYQEAVDDVQMYTNRTNQAYDKYYDLRQKKVKGEDYNEAEYKAARAKLDEMESLTYQALDRQIAAKAIIDPQVTETASTGKAIIDKLFNRKG